jgi:hypothetical protein
LFKATHGNSLLLPHKVCYLNFVIRVGLFVFILTAILGCQSNEERLPETVSYNFHIRPILSDRCFKCHGPDANQRKAEFRLDMEEGAYSALKKSKGAHALVPGKPLESELYLRISTSDTAQLMPPPTSNLKLTEFEIKLIEKWIEQGAQYQKHWAFIPPTKVNVPEVGEDWAKNEIDRFIYQKLEDAGLEPNDDAHPEQLLRRVSFDITGLAPSIELQDKFLQDYSDASYERIMDELLQSKSYGEKMAVAWLDVARYADTHGYQDDGLRTMWPWRDWVIHAFNQNYSYDKFITWQLAGDLIPDANKESILATGFNRNHKITQEGGVIDEEYRIEYVTDRTNTFGKAFLAMTFECSKCHDHKYDPILQRDYFSAFAFFNQLPEKGYQGDIFSGTPADPPRITITNEDITGILNFINKKDSMPVKVMVMKDTVLRPTYLLKRGVYDQPGERVPFNMPASILQYDTTQYPKNRLGLSQWLLSKEHPLTARVFVNRMWQEFFGRGLVKSVGDFGMQGDLPTHPELLDWLALDFMNHGWDIKRLVKQMVTSATYRQSAQVSEKQIARDPENALLSHYPRLRLSAETVRDHALASSGLLVHEIGGPSVKPYQPKGIWEAATSGRGLTKYIQDHGDKLYRKSMYTFIKRTVPPPSMLVFDASNRDQCEVKRIQTNTPLQALVMMNDPQVLEASRVLAFRLEQENSSTEEKISKAFRLIVNRKPKSKELDILSGYAEEEQTSKDSEKLLNIGEYNGKAQNPGLVKAIMLIYNMDEAIVK